MWRIQLANEEVYIKSINPLITTKEKKESLSYDSQEEAHNYRTLIESNKEFWIIQSAY